MSDLPSSSDMSDCNWNVLVAGLPRLEASLVLAPGVSLSPLNSPLSVFDLAAAGAVGFRGWAVLEPISHACHCEIGSDKDATIFPGYDALHRAWLASALLVLRGFTEHICVACSAYSWNTIAGHQERTSGIFKHQFVEEGPVAAVYQSKRELPRFHGNLLDFHLKMLSNQGARTDGVSNDDAVWINKHFNVFNKLAAESEQFRFALEAAVGWRFANDIRSAIARLWSGIEAIFGINSELVFRLSLLSACLLEPPGGSRRLKFEQVKELYGLRSKVVHGERLPDDRIQSALSDSFRLLADLLALTINKGYVLGKSDFDQAIFGDDRL